MVRERHAEEAPRVVVVCDRRPEMGVFPEGWPWLSKPVAVRAVVDLVVDSTLAAHGLFGYLDLARAEGGEPFWRPPRSQAALWEVEERLQGSAFDAPRDNLTGALEQLAGHRRDLPAGTFVFVVSDFLDPPAREAWTRVQEPPLGHRAGASSRIRCGSRTFRRSRGSRRRCSTRHAGGSPRCA